MTQELIISILFTVNINFVMDRNILFIIIIHEISIEMICDIDCCCYSDIHPQ